MCKNGGNINDVKLDIGLVGDAALAYLRDKSVTSSLCHTFDIKCVFIIQPQVYGSSLDQHLEIISATAARFPAAQGIRTEGYKKIIQGCRDCIDMSSALNNLPYSFIDPVHFGKEGSRELGKLFRNLILENMGSLR